MTPLLSLGDHVFEIEPFNFQRLVTETTVKWPAIARFGGRPGRQHTGFGEDPITISGLLYPEELGGGPEFEALRETQRAARPVIMMGWAASTGMAARILGRVVILSVKDTKNRFGPSGMARRMSFDIEVAPIGNENGKPVGLFG